MPADLAPASITGSIQDLRASQPLTALVAPAMTQAEAAAQLERTFTSMQKMLCGGRSEIKEGVDDLLAQCDHRRRAFDVSVPWDGASQRHPFTRYDLHDRLCGNRALLDKLVDQALSGGAEPGTFMSRDILHEVMIGHMRRQVAGARPDASPQEKESGERSAGELYRLVRRLASELRPGSDRQESSVAGSALFGIGTAEWVMNGREQRRISDRTGHFVFGEQVVFVQATLAETAGRELADLMDRRQPGKKSRADSEVYTLINLAEQFGTNAAPMASSLVAVLAAGAPKEALAASRVLPKLGNIGAPALADLWDLNHRTDLPADRRKLIGELAARFDRPAEIADSGKLAMLTPRISEKDFKP